MLLFFAGGGFRGDGSAFLLVGAGGFRVFLAGLFLRGFRGFIAHNFILVLRIDWPAAWNFLRKAGHRALRPADCK